MKLELDGVQLFHEAHGAGDPVVLVHGSWADHHSWDLVVPALARSRRVIAYDRRGHSQSPVRRPANVHQHVADLVALVDHLGAGPVHLVGHSGGASIVLRVATHHPDRVRSLVVHEPPLMDMLEGDASHAEALRGLRRRQAAVEALLRDGHMEEAARTFVEDLAFGPGAWDRLPARSRDTFVRNAPTFLAEIDDPDVLRLDLKALRGYRGPALLSLGDRSPPLFAPVMERVATALPHAARHTFAGAGHVPHLSHPREYVERVEVSLASAPCLGEG